jgi:hypothetical protein
MGTISEFHGLYPSQNIIRANISKRRTNHALGRCTQNAVGKAYDLGIDLSIILKRNVNKQRV